MKKTIQFLLILTTSIFTSVTFAAKDTTMNILVINNTFSTGNAIIGNAQSKLMIGPLLARNGGSGEMSPTVNDESLELIGIQYLNGITPICAQNDGLLALNPSIYKGDLITVTFTGTDANGNLQCTCSGSACDFSAAQPKKSA
jgi:hypothetical protein